jgi:photosystem II stability/assembly factor-like uncharacterized protein
MNLLKPSFPIAFVLFIFQVELVQSQIPFEAETRNYILRNDDFQNRRQTGLPVIFGREYFNAYQQVKRDNSSLNKGSDEWTPIGPFGKEQLAGSGRVNTMQFHPTDTNTWYICVAQGGLWKTTNAGQSWTSISGDLPISRTSYLTIHPTNTDIMYVALGDYAYLGHNLQANENKRNSHYGLGVYKTTDGGAHWKPTGLSFKQESFEGSLTAKVLINKNNPDTIIAVGQTGAYVSGDGGVNWTQTHTGLFWDLEQHPSNNSELIASTGYVNSYKYGKVSILKSTDYGITWTKSTSSMPATGSVQRIELAYSPSDPNYVYAISCDTLGGFYGFYKSTDGGDEFTAQTTSATYAYNILNWSLDDQPGGQGRYDLAICVDRYDKNKVLIGGVNMWQTADGGKNFKPITYWLLNYYGTSLHADIHEIVQHPANNSIFACHDGGISRTFQVIPDDISHLKKDQESYTVWENYTNGLNITSFYRLSINPSNSKELIAGAQDNSTVFTDGSQFRNLSGGDGMESTFDEENMYFYTSSQYGRVYGFSRSGDDFYQDGSFYPPPTERAEWTSPMVYANEQLYVLYGNLYTAWASSLGAAISNFEKMPSYAFSRPGTALAVEKSNGKRIYIGKRGYNSLNIDNRILTSANGGQDWTIIDSKLPNKLYPSYFELNQQNADQVWLTFSGFDSANKVFTSRNAGQTWQNITYDLPNIPVNCVVHQNDGSELIYIGTDMGVYYLEKDSSSWQYFSEGLPKVIVSELEVDPNNQTLVAATFGRGWWEIGLQNFTVGLDKSPIDEPKLTISPNPIRDILTVEIRGISNFDTQLKLVDVTGKVILEDQCNTNETSSKLYDVSHLLPGVYYLILTSPGERSVAKVSKL